MFGQSEPNFAKPQTRTVNIINTRDMNIDRAIYKNYTWKVKFLRKLRGPFDAELCTPYKSKVNADKREEMDLNKCRAFVFEFTSELLSCPWYTDRII